MRLLHIRRSLYLATFGCALILPTMASAATVFNETFTRSNSSTVGGNWAEVNPGGGDALISGNMLKIESNTGGDSGVSYVTQAISNFAPAFNGVLSSHTSPVTWTFNMQSNLADLGGFDSTEEGIAFVIAATGSDLTTANGYAVVWGGTGSTDPIRLVRFAGGLDADANLTDMIVASGASGTAGDPNTNYTSIKVVYTPGTSSFEMFARSDGSSAFADPSAGSYTSAGSVVNSTYTSATMTHIGALARYQGNNDEALFDNVSVEALPEPTSLGLIGIGAVGLLRRRRHNAAR
jgi:hypothetical protein